ncbi:MAG: hypothetical protein ACOYXW_17775 [Actinomycetota bacterium]
MSGRPGDDPVVPDRADDDRDVGWGDHAHDDGDDPDDERILRERPPHW